MAASDNLTSFETWAYDNSWISESIFTSVSPLFDVITPSGVSTSGGVSETETVSKRATQKPTPPKGKIVKRRSRASKRSPTTFITADPENFRQLVQQVTGARFGSGQFPVGSVVKPEPQRAVSMVNRMQAGYLLPTLDTSAFLLDHHHQKAVSPPAMAGFAPPCVVAEAGGGSGFDFDGFSCFPTLESWKVM